MKTYKIKQIFSHIMVLIILCASMMSFSCIKAAEKKVVRIGYPIQEGLTMKDEEGNYYGYTYDYLMQLAQYTGWQYEFVEVEGDLNNQISTLLDMLTKGEIDLLGSMRYNDAMAELFDYPSEPYGSAYNVLLVKEDSDYYDQSSLFSKKDIKIAVLNTATNRIAKLDQFAEMNGFTYTKLSGTEKEILQYMEDGKADFMLGVDLETPKGYRSITRFSPDSFYFATTKGNYEIVTELNQAILNVSKINPLLMTTLYNRYFSKQLDKIILNEKEKEYIEQHTTVRVLVKDGFAPMERIWENNAVGVGKDILDRIASQTGLTFEYVIAKDHDDYQRILESEHIDLLLGLPYDSTFADHVKVNLTSPYMTSNLLLVAGKDTNINALDEQVKGLTYYHAEVHDNNQNLSYYESIEDMIKDIEKGKLDYAYLDAYQTTYYMNKLHTTNITTFTTSDYLKSQYAYGIVKNNDLTLLSIVNKGIQTLDDSALNAMIYENGYIEQSFDIPYYVRTHLPQTILVTVLLLAGIITIIFVYYRRQLEMKHAVELEYRRYLSLSMITGEMTFEYHYLKDTMKISSSGIGKIAHMEVLDHFQAEAAKQEINEHMVLSVLQHYLKQAEDFNDEILIRMIDGNERWYQLIIKIIKDTTTGKERPVYAIGKVLDIQEQKLEKEQLVKDSYTDPLTRVFNRAGGLFNIEEKMKTHPGALMMIDLDHFKDVNDAYGHFAGDEVLIETSNLLSEIFSNGIVSRFGGDEFVIFMPNISHEEMCSLCETLLERMKHVAFAKEKQTALTISMGGVYTKCGDDISDMMEKADSLLYDSKRQGRNQYHIQ